MCILPLQQIVSSASSQGSIPYGYGAVLNNHLIHFPYNPQTSMLTQHTIQGVQWYNSFYATHSPAPSDQSTLFYAQAWFAAYAGSFLSHTPASYFKLLPPSNHTVAQHVLLQIHHHYGHVSFHEIQRWAQNCLHGLEPYLAQCQAPLCSACLYGLLKSNHITQQQVLLFRTLVHQVTLSILIN